MCDNIYEMSKSAILWRLGSYPENSEEGKLWLETVDSMFADNLGMIRDPQDPGSKVSAVGMGEGKPADRSVAKDKKGWAVLEGGDEKVRMAGLERANQVAMAKYKLTSPLPWIESLETEEFAVEGISIKAKTFKAVFSEYCRCKNVDQLISIRRAKWFFECHEASTETKFYVHKDRCNTALHWAEFLVEPAKLGLMFYSELIALTSLPPAALPVKKYLAQTDKIFARYPEAWSLLPDEIQRDHVACCQQFEVACPFLTASLGQEKRVRAPEYRNYAVLYQAAMGKGVYPPGATAKTLGSKRLNNDSCLLMLAVESGHLPPGTTIKDLMSSQHIGPFKAPLYFAALHGQLDKIPGVTAAHLRAVGALALARKQIFEFFRYKDTAKALVNNIVGCPELGAALRIEAPNYRGDRARFLLAEVLKHPGLTREKRSQLAKNRNLTTAML